MSYVDGSDEDYGGDYPSKNDTVYSYTDSANSIQFSIVNTTAATAYSPPDEPACTVQQVKFKTEAAAIFGDDPNKPSSWIDAGKQDLDRLNQKLQDDLKADPGKYSFQCFGPPQQPQDFLDKPPEFPFEKPEREEERPEPPEEFFRSPFFESRDPFVRLILGLGENWKEE